MNQVFGKIVYHTLQILRREPVFKIYKELKASEKLSLDDLKTLQFNKLKKLISFAYENIDFYREIYKNADFHPQDLKLPEQVTKIPIISRPDLQKKYTLPGKLTKSNYKANTAGTTGESLTLYVDNLSWAYHHANIFRTLSWFGVKPRAPEARIWGRRIDASANFKTQVKDLLFNRMRLNVFNMEKEIEKFVKDLYKFKPQYLYGYPSAIIQFSEILQEKKLIPPQFKVIACTSEQLTASQLITIKNFFDTEVTDIYGAAEVGIISSQCPHGGRHIPVESIWLDIENQQKIFNDFTIGDVVVTDLNNYVMPIIRYSIGDVSNFESGTCTCGLAHPRLGQIKGRILEIIETAGGYKTNSAFTYYLFKGFESKEKSIRQYQLIQKSKDNFLVKLVMDADLNDDHILYFNKTLKEYLGSEIQISVSKVDHIPVGRSAKYMIFRKEI